ncbi:MAG: inorganic phosphate transporter [Deltaproteobacteria bacterium]|nr:inorganic phosphate transporter [Deltaproteobacteria bacterium]
MATVVSSRALTLRRAIIIAGIFEFLGAFLVGSHVTDTVRKGIIDPLFFVSQPELLAYGMFSALLAAAIFQHTATFFGLPVSTTHAIVGSLFGFGLIGAGVGSVNWSKIGVISSGWVISPLLGAIVAFTLFSIIRKLIFAKDQPYQAAVKVAPFLVLVQFTIIALSIIYKGLKNLHLDFPFSQALSISLLFGGLGAYITWMVVKGDKALKDQKEQYEKVQKIFAHLQIYTASYIAFAHGANDVANAIGPVAAIFSIFQTNTIIMKVNIPIWILLLGGIGIVAGLSTYGYKVIETIGRKITEITPTRGFTAEFSTATTVLIFSKLGIPISTTHTLVGSIIGVGFARGIATLNLRVILNIITSWFITIPTAAILTVIIYKVILFITTL